MQALALINRDLSHEVERLAAEVKQLQAENASLRAQLRQSSDGRYYLKHAIDLDPTPGSIDPPASLTRPQRYEPQTETNLAGTAAVERHQPVATPAETAQRPAARDARIRNLRALVLAILAHGPVWLRTEAPCIIQNVPCSNKDWNRSGKGRDRK
jgi:hypothetical protein